MIHPHCVSENKITVKSSQTKKKNYSSVRLTTRFGPIGHHQFDIEHKNIHTALVDIEHKNIHTALVKS